MAWSSKPSMEATAAAVSSTASLSLIRRRTLSQFVLWSFLSISAPVGVGFNVSTNAPTAMTARMERFLITVLQPSPISYQISPAPANIGCLSVVPEGLPFRQKRLGTFLCVVHAEQSFQIGLLYSADLGQESFWRAR